MSTSELPTPSRVLAHVPPELVVPFNIYRPCAENEDFYLAWRTFQDQAPGPLVWSTRQGGHWIPTRGADVYALYKDHERLSSDHNFVPTMPGEQPPLGAIGLDPPQHTHYRKFLNVGLSPRALQAREAQSRALAVGLIEALAGRGHCEFIGEYADLLPFTMLLDLVSLPMADREQLGTWAAWVLRGNAAQLAEGFERMAAYLAPVILARRGGEGEDLISRIANTRIEGELLPLAEAVGAACHLMFAGQDTVASMLGLTFRFLARNPALQRELAGHPERIPAAVNELLRRFPNVIMSRRVRADMELHGVTLKTDDMVALPTMLYNLDPAVYPDPLEVKMDRDVKDICTFGNGPHRCPGAPLGRTQIIVTLEEWLRRVPTFRLEDESDQRVRGGIVAVIERLPLRWAN